MSKFIVLFIFIIGLFSCNHQTVETDTAIKVKLTGIDSDSLLFINSNYKKQTLKLTDDYYYADSIEVGNGFGSIIIDDNWFEIYTKPGELLEAELNINGNKVVAIYTGNFIEENNYLLKKYNQSKGFEKIMDYKYYGKLSETSFLSLIDSVYNLKFYLLNNSSEKLNDEFVFLESNKIKYELLREKALFEVSVSIATSNKSYKVSDAYSTALYKNIDLGNERLVSFSDYISFISSYLYNEAQRSGSANTDLYLKSIEILGEKVENKVVKEQVAFRNKRYLTRTQNVDELYFLMNQFISKPNYQKEIEKIYKTIKKVSKGEYSPTFKLPDLNGKEINLENLKGNIVYIDIWSTGCSFCMADMPHLKKLEKLYKGKNICFVGINIDESVDKWKNTVKNKNLIGVQLHATNTKIPFFKDYVVKGIPRYILLDKEGRIVDSSAKRPDDPLLIEEVNKIL